MAATAPAPPYPTITTSASLSHFTEGSAALAVMLVNPVKAVAPLPAVVVLRKARLEKTFASLLRPFIIYAFRAEERHLWADADREHTWRAGIGAPVATHLPLSFLYR